MGKKGDLSDFEQGVVVAARSTGLNVLETADPLGFHAQPSLGFGKNWCKKR